MSEATSVDILDTVACPPAHTTEIQILLRRDNAICQLSQGIRRPSHFERISTTIARGVSAMPGVQGPPPRTPRDLLRNILTFGSSMRTRFGPPLSIDQPVLDMRNVVPQNISHLLMEIIPTVLHARKVIGDQLVVAVRPFSRNASPNYASFLAEFDIEPIYTFLDIAAPIVKLRLIRTLSAFDLEPAWQYPRYSFFPDCYTSCYSGLNSEGQGFPEKIFIARRGARSLENQVELQNFLESCGYVTVYMEDFSVREQLTLGANARHVVTVHSASMAPLVMNRHIESLVEIFPPHVFHEYYAIAFQDQVRRHICVVPEFDDRLGYADWSTTLALKSRRFSLGIDLLKRAVSLGHEKPDRHSHSL